jgi:hypothetical protein
MGAMRPGAVVEVVWPRSKISAEADDRRPALGQNRPIRVG